MSKKIYGYSMCAVIVFWIFGIVFQIYGMDQPMSDTQKLKLSSDDIQKNIEDGKKNLKPSGEIYLYNPQTGQGAIFEKELISMSVTLQDMLNDLGDESKAAPFLYNISASIIQSVHDILRKCEKFREKNKEEYSQKCSQIVIELSQQFDFNTLLLVLESAHHLNVDKEIRNALIKKTTDIIFDGNRGITGNDFQILKSINSDLWHEIIGSKWDIFIEKMKIAVAKKYSGEAKEKYSYTVNKKSNDLGVDSNIRDMSFSPDGKFLCMRSEWFNSDRQYITTDGCLIITIADKQCKNILTQQGLPREATAPYFFNGSWGWIDKNKFCCIGPKTSITLNLYFYDCMLQKSTIEQLPLPTYEQFSSLYVKSSLRIGSEIVFFYSIHDANFKGCGIGTFNPKDKTTIYQKLENVPEVYGPKIISKSKEMVNFICSRGLKHILYEYEFKTKKLTELKEFDSSLLPVFNNSGKKIAFNSANGIGVYCIDKRNEIECLCNKSYQRSLTFSPDEKVITAIEKDKIVFFSAITGEYIEEFQSHEGLCFENNDSAVFSSDGSKFAVCGNSSDIIPLLIMDFIPDEYISIFDYLRNNVLSFGQIIWLIWLQKRSQNGKNSVTLTDQEKEIFGEFSYTFAQLLIDIKYVVPVQMSEAQENEKKEGIKNLYISDLREQKNAEEYIKSKQRQRLMIDDLSKDDYNELAAIVKGIEEGKKTIEDLRQKKVAEYKYKKLISKEFGTQRTAAKILQQARKDESLTEEPGQIQPTIQLKQQRSWSDVWNDIKKNFWSVISRVRW